MTETTPNAPSSKPRSLTPLIVLGILLIVILGFVASRQGIDRALVKQALDNLAAQLKERGNAQGSDFTLTYGELEVTGGFTNKHVVVHDPVLEVKPKAGVAVSSPVGRTAPKGLRISTEKAEIYADASDMSSVRVDFPSMINFVGIDDQEKSLLKISANEPLEFTSTQQKEGDALHQIVAFKAPTNMELTYLRESQAKGEEDKAPTVTPVYETLNVASSSGSGFSSDMLADGSSVGVAKVYFNNLVLTPKETPQNAIRIGEVTGEWSNLLNADKSNSLRAALKFGPVASDSKDVPYLPVMLDFDASYTGPSMHGPEAGQASAAPMQSVMTLKGLSLTTKDAKLSGAANFTASAGDVLPVGSARLTLTNVPYVLGELRKYGIVNPQNEQGISDVISKIAGVPIAQVKDLDIPIQRPQGGSFRIGNATVEELLALLMKGAMQQQGQTAPATSAPIAPKLPDANRTKSAPIPIKDPSTRG